MNNSFERIKKDNELFIELFIKLVKSFKFNPPNKSDTTNYIKYKLDLAHEITKKIEKEHPYQSNFKHLYISSTDQENPELSFMDSKQQFWFFTIKEDKIEFSHVINILGNDSGSIKYTENEIVIEVGDEPTEILYVVPNNIINKELCETFFLINDIDISAVLEPDNQIVKFPNPEMLSFVNDDYKTKIKKRLKSILR